LSLTATACSSSGSSSPAAAASSAPAGCTSPSGATGPGVGATTIGFIYVGSTGDYGYNEAAHEGAMALKKACPNLKVLEADEIPETSQMATTAQQMISEGAKIIFSTSYGYESYALNLAKKYPQVVFLQQGNYINPPLPDNLNTYFGNVYETVYMAGIAAGLATKTNKLGFVMGFPIPQTLLNVDAFELGAQSVNPKAQTYVTFTNNWCDPAKQSDAANSLLGQGVDVLTQHQDCQTTVVKAAAAKGAYVVGYHYDAQALDPSGWLTGSDWDWAPLYQAMVKSVLAGKFAGSQFNADYSLGYAGSKTVPSPMVLAPFGPSVSDSTKSLITAVKTKILGGWSPFTGPIYDQSGKLQLKAGQVATAQQIAGLNYLVKGVIGTLPAS
jgi:simple sugar transport system substrate-binding protein/basic membrane protein A